MGGYGSGRYGGKPTVEGTDAVVLSAAVLRGIGHDVTCYRHPILVSRCGHVLRVGIDIDTGAGRPWAALTFDDAGLGCTRYQ